MKLRGKAGLAEYIDNIELVNGFFSGHLKLNSDDQGQGPILNMEEIQKVISSSVRQLPIGKLRTFPVMKYQYEGTIFTRKSTLKLTFQRIKNQTSFSSPTAGQ